MLQWPGLKSRPLQLPFGLEPSSVLNVVREFDTKGSWGSERTRVKSEIRQVRHIRQVFRIAQIVAE